MRTSPALVLSVLLLAAPVLAQITSGEAVAQVKAAGKLQVKAYKESAQAALVQLDANLDEVEDGLSEDSDPSELVGAVADAAETLLATLDEALSVAVHQVSAATAEALDDLPPPLEGLFPEPLYYGTSGALDDALSALSKAAGKTRAALLKRLHKTAAKAEAKGGVAMTIALQWPRAQDLEPIDADNTFEPALGAELELAVAGSALDAQDDGVVVVAGASDETLDVEVQLFDADGQHDAATAVFHGFRFSAVLDLEGKGLREGNYVAAASQGSGPPRSLLPVGLR